VSRSTQRCQDRRQVWFWFVLAGFGFWLGTALPAGADISGQVLEDGSNAPIGGATVHLQADLSSPAVVTAADGSFILPVNPIGVVTVSAGVEYDRAAAANWATGGTTAVNGQTGVIIYMVRIPADSDPNYEDFLPQVQDCGNCHHDQEDQWRNSNHSFAGDDAWVLDLYSGDGTSGGSAGYVYLDTHDPGETGFCATCHTPLADVFVPGGVLLNEVTSVAALEGVSCIACHQMDSVNDQVQNLHHVGNSTYRFPDGSPFIPTQEFVWGPLDDVAFGGMKPSFAPLFAQARFCASCHEYDRPGTTVPGQTTYSEWLASPFATPGPGFRSCQDCHMPQEDGPGYLVEPIGNPPIRPAEQRHRHEMVGATEATLQTAISLGTSVEEGGGTVVVRSEVTNHGAGHNFPTRVSVRNALLVITATWNGQPLNQISGPTVPFWADDNVPGKQDGDYAGEAGTGFARVLEGRINGQGPPVKPVLFIDGEGIDSATQIPAASSNMSEVAFVVPPAAQPGDVVVVEARLLYRRAWRAVAVTKGWDTTPQGGPVEIEVWRTYDTLELTQGGTPAAAIPATGTIGTAIFIALLAMSAVFILRRTMG